MRRMLSRLALLVVAVAWLFVALPAGAATIDVLWYSGGVVNPGPDYKTSMNALAASAPGGNTWSITYWDSGAIPAGSFDVLVTASETGGWTTFPSYTALTGAIGTTPSSFFGDRVLVTGQDTDWHYLNGPGDGTTAQVFNGPRGWLTDAINWAGSGSGLGGVILNADPIMDLFSGLGLRENNHGNVVNIPPANAGFPINAGLTSAGISNWNTSHHDAWTGWSTALWTGINMTTDSPGLPSTTNCSADTTNPDGKCAVTLVTAATAGGGTTPVPEPGTLLLLGSGLLGSAMWARRRRTQ